MRQAGVALAAGLALATPLAAAPPESVTNARVESRSAGSGLAATVKAAMASRSGPLWIGWAVPAQGEHDACCWSSAGDAKRGRWGCRLEGKGEGAFRRADGAPLPLEGGRRMLVLLRADAGRVLRIRAYSEDCTLDAGGLALLWLEDARPAESVSLLATFAGRPDTGGGEELEHAALAAIAFHADSTADSALERLVHPREPLERRRQAAFWLGQARGERGFQVLARLVREDADPSFREHAVFALSQSREPAAVDTIIEVARKDASADVRGQALFWLAQTAARRAPQAGRPRRRPGDRGQEEGRLRPEPASPGRGRAPAHRAGPDAQEPRSPGAGDVLAGTERRPSRARLLRGGAPAVAPVGAAPRVGPRPASAGRGSRGSRRSARRPSRRRGDRPSRPGLRRRLGLEQASVALSERLAAFYAAADAGTSRV